MSDQCILVSNVCNYGGTVRQKSCSFMVLDDVKHYNFIVSFFIYVALD